MAKAEAPTASVVVDDTRRRLGKVGVWLLDVFMARESTAEVERREVARIEKLGYGSLWVAEGVGGKEAFAHLGILLAATQRLVIGAGIANLGARHPAAMQGGAATLAEAYPGRFVLGVGTGWTLSRPVEAMRHYLDAMDAPHEMAPGLSVSAPDASFPRVLAALGPRMLKLAGERADGAHPFSAPLEHTRIARQVLGPHKLLVPEQTVVFDVDPARARAAARESVARGLEYPGSPYTANLRRLGYGDADFADGGSDRLVNSRIAWGNA
jgi:probable F420-dependent oxidoreductase